MRRAALALIPMCALAAPAAADEAPRDGAHFGLGAGGYLALAGVGDAGPAAQIELYPGGAWRRFGLRAAAYGFDYDLNGALVTAGVTYTAAAARPKLHVAFHGEGAVTVDDPEGTRAGAGGGIHTQLWLWGPLAVGLDTTVHILFGGDDDVTAHLASAATVRLSF